MKMNPKYYYFLLLLLSFLALNANPVLAKEKNVKVIFEFEGKEQSMKKFAVIFHTNNGSFLAVSKKDKFEIPRELTKGEAFDVQVVWYKYSVSFSSLSYQDFDAIWTIGVDTVPLEDESLRITKNSQKELKGVYYLKIDPEKSRATMQVVEVFK
jgi:hypothetical protein